MVVKGDRAGKFQTWWPGPEGIISSLQMTLASPTVVLLGRAPTVAMSPYMTGKELAARAPRPSKPQGPQTFYFHKVL